jgi:hypothetical protein
MPHADWWKHTSSAQRAPNLVHVPHLGICPQLAPASTGGKSFPIVRSGLVVPGSSFTYEQSARWALHWVDRLLCWRHLRCMLYSDGGVWLLGGTDATPHLIGPLAFTMQSLRPTNLLASFFSKACLGLHSTTPGQQSRGAGGELPLE